MPGSGTIANIKVEVQRLQMRITVLNVCLMGIGGCIFGLGVLARPILRIILPEYLSWVRRTVDMMVLTGLWQIAIAGFGCFAANWARLIPLWMGIGSSGLLILFEMVTLAHTFYLPSQADTFVTERVYRAWYLWECQDLGSCSNAFYYYIYYYMIPQAGLTTIAVFLQCLAIMYLYRCIRALNEKHLRIYGSRENVLNISAVPAPVELETRI